MFLKPSVAPGQLIPEGVWPFQDFDAQKSVGFCVLIFRGFYQKTVHHGQIGEGVIVLQVVPEIAHDDQAGARMDLSDNVLRLQQLLLGAIAVDPALQNAIV